MKEFAVKFCDHTDMYSLDDKCKIDIGEPNHPIAAVDEEKSKHIRHLPSSLVNYLSISLPSPSSLLAHHACTFI